MGRHFLQIRNLGDLVAFDMNTGNGQATSRAGRIGIGRSPSLGACLIYTHGLTSGRPIKRRRCRETPNCQIWLAATSEEELRSKIGDSQR